MKRLEGRVALVTGASRGIGRAVAVRLAKEGARVFVNYSRGLEAAEETVRLCNEVGSGAEVLGFDVASSTAVDEAFAQIKERAGKLDVLVNNAGIAHDGLLLRMKDEEWKQVMDTNLSGAFYCARAAAKLMIKGRYGRIIAISSVVGEMGNAGQVPYVSSKAGMIGMTKAMARELSSRGITSNAVAPGFIETDMTNSLDENLKAEHFKTIPLARYGQPEDIAAAVAFLASEEAGYITGHTLSVNGGMYM